MSCGADDICKQFSFHTCSNRFSNENFGCNTRDLSLMKRTSELFQFASRLLPFHTHTRTHRTSRLFGCVIYTYVHVSLLLAWLLLSVCPRLTLAITIAMSLWLSYLFIRQSISHGARLILCLYRRHVCNLTVTEVQCACVYVCLCRSYHINVSEGRRREKQRMDTAHTAILLYSVEG